MLTPIHHIPLIFTLSLLFSPAAQSSDCDTLLFIYKAMGGQTKLRNGCQLPNIIFQGMTSISSQSSAGPNGNTYTLTGQPLGTSEIAVMIGWRYQNLRGPIPKEIGKLTNLTSLDLGSNQLNGSIPSEIGLLSKLRHLSLNENNLSGQVPSQIGNLKSLKKLFLHKNQLTGVPSSLSTLNSVEKMVLFPNPMSVIPYDVFVQNPAAALSPTNWTTLLQVPVFSKRQMTSTLSAASLYQMCPLNQIQNKEVVAGCIAGIYNNFCRISSALAECHSAYNQVVSQSYFSPLLVCAAWKNGPSSSACSQAILNFYVPLDYMTLRSVQANDFVSTIFRSPTYAPCFPSSILKCNW